MMKIKSDLYEEIDRQFRSLGIRVPYPQEDLHVNVTGKSAPALSGKSKDGYLNLCARKAPCA
jgi:small-conductance mechanosensitive channel